MNVLMSEMFCPELSKPVVIIQSEDFPLNYCLGGFSDNNEVRSAARWTLCELQPVSLQHGVSGMKA